MSPDYEEFATTQRCAVMDVDEASDSDSYYTADSSPSPFPSPNISSSSTLPADAPGQDTLQSPAPPAASFQSYQNSPSGLTNIMSSAELAPTPVMSSVAPPSYHNLSDTSPAPSYSSHPASSPRTFSPSHVPASASSMLSPIPLPCRDSNTLGLNVMSPTAHSDMSTSMDDNDATPRVPRRITVTLGDHGHRRRAGETEDERRADQEIRSVRRIVEVDELATLRERVMVLMNDITTLQNVAIAEKQRLSESQAMVIRLQQDIADMQQSFEAEVARRCAEREDQLEQAALARAEQGCRDKQNELAVAAVGLEKERVEWGKRVSIERAELDTAKTELSQQRSEIEERRRKLEADLSQHEVTLQSQSAELNEKLAAVAMEHEKMEGERDTLDRARSEMAQERVALEKERGQVERGRQEVTEARMEVERARLEAEKARNEVEADRAKLRTRVSEMEQPQRRSSSTITPPPPSASNTPSRSGVASPLGETPKLKPSLWSTGGFTPRKSSLVHPPLRSEDISLDNGGNPAVDFVTHQGKAPSRRSHWRTAPTPIYPSIEPMDLDYPDAMDLMPGGFFPSRPPLQLREVARRAVYRWASPETLSAVTAQPTQGAPRFTEMLDDAPFRISDHSDEDDHAVRVTPPAVARAAAMPPSSKPGCSNGGHEDDEDEDDVLSLLGTPDRDQTMDNATSGSDINMEDDGDDESSDTEEPRTNKLVDMGKSRTKSKRSNLPNKINEKALPKGKKLMLHAILREVLCDRYGIDTDMDWCRLVPATNEEVEAYENERGPGPTSVTKPYIGEGWRRKRWNVDIFNMITAEFMKECATRGVRPEAEDKSYALVFYKCDRGFQKWRAYLARPGETAEQYVKRNTDQYNAELSRARTNTNRRNKFQRRFKIAKACASLFDGTYRGEVFAAARTYLEVGGDQCMSSEEDCVERTTGTRVHRRKHLIWRPREVSPVMVMLDTARHTPGLFSSQGSTPMLSLPGLKTSSRSAPKGLPLSFYDSKWYSALSPYKKQLLDAQRHVDLDTLSVFRAACDRRGALAPTL
ncbi:hypothetical protein C8Q78DRAFT_1074081 [Trametes maxima]|nr:hypothetical protein C8Q78DRAFT_1074081 [Trametes maxima]